MGPLPSHPQCLPPLRASSRVGADLLKAAGDAQLCGQLLQRALRWANPPTAIGCGMPSVEKCGEVFRFQLMDVRSW